MESVSDTHSNGRPVLNKVDYYRHKYLAIACFLMSLMVVLELAEWKSAPSEHKQIFLFTALAVASVLAARERLLVAAVGVTLFAARALFAFILQPSIEVFT